MQLIEVQLLVFPNCSLHQKYVNTCTLNGDGDNFGVTDHKAEERLVSTAEKTNAGSIQNCEHEPMLEERSVLELEILVQVLSKILKMTLC